MTVAASYKRPPVPSAEESSRAGWIAPLIGIFLNAVFGKQSHDPMVVVAVGSISVLIILIGLAASIWGFYVAAFYGPRKHILPAVVGFTINLLLIVCLIIAFQRAIEAKAEYEQRESSSRPVSQASEITAATDLSSRSQPAQLAGQWKRHALLAD